MDDVSTLLTAITGLVSAVGGLLAGAALIVRLFKRERRRAAPTVADEIAEAAADGELTADEIINVLRKRGELP